MGLHPNGVIHPPRVTTDHPGSCHRRPVSSVLRWPATASSACP